MNKLNEINSNISKFSILPIEITIQIMNFLDEENQKKMRFISKFFCYIYENFFELPAFISLKNTPVYKLFTEQNKLNSGIFIDPDSLSHPECEHIYFVYHLLLKQPELFFFRLQTFQNIHANMCLQNARILFFGSEQNAKKLLRGKKPGCAILLADIRLPRLVLVMVEEDQQISIQVIVPIVSNEPYNLLTQLIQFKKLALLYISKEKEAAYFNHRFLEINIIKEMIKGRPRFSIYSVNLLDEYKLYRPHYLDKATPISPWDKADNLSALEIENIIQSVLHPLESSIIDFGINELYQYKKIFWYFSQLLIFHRLDTLNARLFWLPHHEEDLHTLISSKPEGTSLFFIVPEDIQENTIPEAVVLYVDKQANLRRTSLPLFHPILFLEKELTHGDEKHLLKKIKEVVVIGTKKIGEEVEHFTIPLNKILSELKALRLSATATQSFPVRRTQNSLAWFFYNIMHSNLLTPTEIQYFHSKEIWEWCSNYLHLSNFLNTCCNKKALIRCIYFGSPNSKEVKNLLEQHTSKQNFKHITQLLVLDIVSNNNSIWVCSLGKEPVQLYFSYPDLHINDILLQLLSPSYFTQNLIIFTNTSEIHSIPLKELTQIFSQLPKKILYLDFNLSESNPSYTQGKIPYLDDIKPTFAHQDKTFQKLMKACELKIPLLDEEHVHLYELYLKAISRSEVEKFFFRFNFAQLVEANIGLDGIRILFFGHSSYIQNQLINWGIPNTVIIYYDLSKKYAPSLILLTKNEQCEHYQIDLDSVLNDKPYSILEQLPFLKNKNLLVIKNNEILCLTIEDVKKEIKRPRSFFIPPMLHFVTDVLYDVDEPYEKRRITPWKTDPPLNIENIPNLLGIQRLFEQEATFLQYFFLPEFIWKTQMVLFFHRLSDSFHRLFWLGYVPDHPYIPLLLIGRSVGTCLLNLTNNPYSMLHIHYVDTHQQIKIIPISKIMFEHGSQLEATLDWIQIHNKIQLQKILILNERNGNHEEVPIDVIFEDLNKVRKKASLQESFFYKLSKTEFKFFLINLAWGKFEWHEFEIDHCYTPYSENIALFCSNYLSLLPLISTSSYKENRINIRLFYLGSFHQILENFRIIPEVGLLLIDLTAKKFSLCYLKNNQLIEKVIDFTQPNWTILHFLSSSLPIKKLIIFEGPSAKIESIEQLKFKMGLSFKNKYLSRLLFLNFNVSEENKEKEEHKKDSAFSL